jgi:parallel beta-helix repeat protein
MKTAKMLTILVLGLMVCVVTLGTVFTPQGQVEDASITANGLNDLQNKLYDDTNVGSGSYAQVFTVAQSGGDFTTIGQALSACVNPGPNKTYLIKVMPGIYNESVVCSSFVRLQGAGKYICYITGLVTGADNCTIDDFNITKGVTCSGTSPTIIHNIITNDTGDGIYIKDGGKPWIKENEIVDCNEWGINCEGFETYSWIIANKIERNIAGGIKCNCSHPTISNNQILRNHNYGIYLIGDFGLPSEPTIDDNVIALTVPSTNGIGIYMKDYAEPRIIANDFWVNYTAIWIEPYTQPSILSNAIAYNSYGIRCFSSGYSNVVVIKGNHIHSNDLFGIDVGDAMPAITHNNLYNFNVGGTDIQYTGPNSFPMISFNVFDTVSGTGANGSYNVNFWGASINP